MDKIFSLHLHLQVSSESAWTLLQSHGIEVLYSEEEEGLKRLIVKTSLEPNALLNAFSFLRQCQEVILPKIDWETEWMRHAPGFSEGKLPLDLKPFGKNQTLYLVPGAGFGNLSHPTTRLMLALMKGRVEGQDVVDIGSGSGVLAIAAAALGARSVIGIDIDPEANAHARENAALNGFPGIKFYLPEELPPFVGSFYVLLMNMILSEQKDAWKSFEQRVRGILLTSGVLKEQEEEYRALAERWGWKVQQVVEEEGWLGFIFRLVGR